MICRTRVLPCISMACIWTVSDTGRSACHAARSDEFIVDTLTGTNDMDGVVGVTQRAIPPGQSFTYAFTVGSDQAGTFW